MLTGYGINTEREMALACNLAGAEAKIIHIRQLMRGEIHLDEQHLLVFPGGFSFGDELGAAKAFANRLEFASTDEKGSFKEKLLDFVGAGKCILAVCNGFQLLVKLGVLPDGSQQKMTLTHNENGRFENRWVQHRIHSKKCVFTKGLDHLYLPVRHGEGNFFCPDKNLLQTLFNEQQIALQYANKDGELSNTYPNNPNGSMNSVAGICDATGRILGMMAHPEGALFPQNHPHWSRQKWSDKKMPEDGEGMALFKNAIHYLRERFAA